MLGLLFSDRASTKHFYGGQEVINFLIVSFPIFEAGSASQILSTDVMAVTLRPLTLAASQPRQTKR